MNNYNRDTFLLNILEQPKKNNSKTFNYMLSVGMFSMETKGLPIIEPLGMLILNKIKNIVTRNLNQLGPEISFPNLVLKNVFINSGRIQNFHNEVFNTKDHVLTPTAEEQAFSYYLNSSLNNICSNQIKNNILFVHQVNKKYRNEIRTKGYINRSLEFLMSDGYSISCDLNKSNTFYNEISNIYLNIFKECGLDKKIFKVKSDAKSMNGINSHEFIYSSNEFQESVFFKYNNEYIEENLINNTDNISNKLYGLEIGHIFQLGKLENFNLLHHKKNKNIENTYLGSYGIGIFRLLVAAISESLHNEKIFCSKIAPFDCSFYVNDITKVKNLFNNVKNLNFLFYNNDFSKKIFFNEINILRIPFFVYEIKKNEFEFHNLKNNKITKFTFEKLYMIIQSF